MLLLLQLLLLSAGRQGVEQFVNLPEFDGYSEVSVGDFGAE